MAGKAQGVTDTLALDALGLSQANGDPFQGARSALLAGIGATALVGLAVAVRRSAAAQDARQRIS